MKPKPEPQLSKNKKRALSRFPWMGTISGFSFPPGRRVYYARFIMRGKAYLRTLKTGNQADAAARAKVVIRRIKWDACRLREFSSIGMGNF